MVKSSRAALGGNDESDKCITIIRSVYHMNNTYEMPLSVGWSQFFLCLIAQLDSFLHNINFQSVVDVELL